MEDSAALSALIRLWQDGAVHTAPPPDESGPIQFLSTTNFKLFKTLLLSIETGSSASKIDCRRMKTCCASLQIWMIESGANDGKLDDLLGCDKEARDITFTSLLRIANI